MRSLAIWAGIALLAASATSAQQVVSDTVPHQAAAEVPQDYGAPIALELAEEIIRAGIDLSKKLGLRQSFAIVEPSGELVAFARMNNVGYGSIRAAQLKARTSARYRVATAVREQQVQAGRLVILSNDEVLAIGGGVPIVRNGQVIGAVGVSGGSAEQDAFVGEEIARKK